MCTAQRSAFESFGQIPGYAVLQVCERFQCVLFFFGKTYNDFSHRGSRVYEAHVGRSGDDTFPVLVGVEYFETYIFENAVIFGIFFVIVVEKFFVGWETVIFLGRNFLEGIYRKFQIQR